MICKKKKKTMTTGACANRITLKGIIKGTFEIETPKILT